MLRAQGKRKILKSRGEAFAMCFPPPGGMMDRTRRRYLGDGAGDLWLLENIIVFNLLMAFYQDLSETAVRSEARYLMKSKINKDKIILQVGARGWSGPSSAKRRPRSFGPDPKTPAPSPLPSYCPQPNYLTLIKHIHDAVRFTS